MGNEVSDRISLLELSSVALLVLAAPSAFAGGSTQTNPPSECNASDSTCECETGDESSDGCIKANLDMGRTTPWTGSRPCALKVFADDQSPMVFTPESLFAVCGYAFKRIGNRLLPDRETPKDVVLSHPGGEAVTFVFAEGESVARPDPGVHVKMDERLQMTDAQGWACTNSPVYYDLYETDGTVRRFLATDRTGERGKLVSVTDSRGVRHTAADLGLDFVYGPDGVRQFLTPSRLADVRVVEGGYDVDVYALDAVPPKGAGGLYALPTRAPVKRLSVRSENGGNRARLVFRDGGERTYLFDWVRGDWSLTRPSGAQEVRGRSVVDSKAAQTTHEVRSRAGGLLSRDEYNYVWKSWGFAATNHVEGFGAAVRTTEWTYFTSGGGKGQVQTELKSSGLRTEYAYDAEGRVVSVKRSGPDMMTELVTTSYASVDPSDVVPPVDSRPRTVVRTLDGVECERTYYVYSSLTDIVERVGVQGAPYGGTNALRTVTAYYPVVAGDVRSGRVRSVRREDGRLDLHDYALVTNVWTETVMHLHEQLPAPVSGRTTRDVRVTNARGEVAEERTEAFVGGAWHAIARSRMAYSLEGRRIRAEDLAGRVTTTEWDCCRKVAETPPDGSATAWDYDDGGRLVASSRLVPLDLANVTWITTCYAYDDLGRQTAAWTTNFAARAGLPATTTRYDALGRVIARTDVIGNATTTGYSADGRVVSVHNPNASTAVSTRSPGGDILSVAGTAVTPEFRSFGILPDGTRWTCAVQGESADSPRFTKRHENMLGQVVREERSGFRGVVLATVNAYDAYGRVASVTADGESATAYLYDDLGSRIATIRTADGQWRRTETRLAYVLADGVVWQVQTNVTSCSDAAIAPLVTSQAVQLTGLTADAPARTRSADVRGNVTESWTEHAGGVTTARRRVPGATNVVSSRSRFGVSLESVSASAVTNRTVYDALGRVSASIDGRGNATRTGYDAAGRRGASFDGAGNPTRYAYDRLGNLAAVTNALGHATVYECDLRGRKTYEGGATYPVRYAYDVFGNRTSMTTYRDESRGRDSGDVTTWLYDEASGAMTNKVYADGMGPRYDYDANGRLARRTWARGVDTFYAYDGWGNLTNTAYSDGTPTVAIRYDALGRPVEVRDAAGITTFAYDAYGANTNETVVGVAGTNVLERFTDGFGRDAGYALNGIRQSTLGYDPVSGRLATMHAPSHQSSTSNFNFFTWNYLAGSDLKSSLTYPNGLTASWQCDANNQLIQVRNAFPTNVISQYDYTYDAAGSRTLCAMSGYSFMSDNTNSLFYNLRGELTNVVASADADYRYGYKFDDAGNREITFECGSNTTYVASRLNQYTRIATSGADAFVPEFDDDGNQTLVKTATGIWSVEYNGENRPVLWTCGTTNIVMSFDRMGRRVIKNGQRFVYNGYLQISSFASTEATTTSNRHSFIWNPAEPVATSPLVWNVLRSIDKGWTHDETRFYIHDGNKNVSDVITMKGCLVAHYEYAPFGVITKKYGADAVANPWRFSCEFADDDIDVMYYNYRHYCAVIGRWLTYDLNGMSDDVNQSCFLHNAPEGNFDYLGNECSNYGDPYVVETKTDETWQPMVVRRYMKSAEEEIISQYPIPIPIGGGGFIIKKSRCKCVCVEVGTRVGKRRIMEHKMQTKLCVYNDACPPVSLTYENDLGWQERLQDLNDKKVLSEFTLYARPLGGGICNVPINCDVPCASACSK